MKKVLVLSLVAVAGIGGLTGCGGATQDVIYVPVDPNGARTGGGPVVMNQNGGGQVGTDSERPPLDPVFVPKTQPTDSESEDPKFFPELVKSTRTTMQSQDHGLMAAVQFMNQSTQFRRSFLVGDSEGLTPLKDDPNRYISFLNGMDGEILTIFVASLQPGHYECSSAGFAIGFSFTGEDPLADKTAWSDVGSSFCSFDLTRGPGPDDIEGRFRGMITQNDKQATYNIADGYFFSRKPMRGVSRAPTPPQNPSHPKPHGGLNGR